MFKFKTRYYLHLFMPETMKLLRSTESKITEDKNGENVPDLEMTEILLTVIINKNQQPYIPLFLINCLINY